MADDIKFQTITDLYNHLLPAIRTKLEYFKKRKMIDVKELDIWDYCLKNIWINKSNLNIYDMVNDILFVDELEVQYYLKKGK